MGKPRNQWLRGASDDDPRPGASSVPVPLVPPRPHKHGHDAAMRFVRRHELAQRYMVGDLPKSQLEVAQQMGVCVRTIHDDLRSEEFNRTLNDLINDQLAARVGAAIRLLSLSFDDPTIPWANRFANARWLVDRHDRLTEMQARRGMGPTGITVTQMPEEDAERVRSILDARRAQMRALEAGEPPEPPRNVVPEDPPTLFDVG